MNEQERIKTAFNCACNCNYILHRRCNVILFFNSHIEQSFVLAYDNNHNVWQVSKMRAYKITVIYERYAVMFFTHDKSPIEALKNAGFVNIERTNEKKANIVVTGLTVNGNRKYFYNAERKQGEQ